MNARKYYRFSSWLLGCSLVAFLGISGCGNSSLSGSSSSGGSSSGSPKLSAHSSLLWTTEFGGATLPSLLSGQTNPPGNQLTGLATTTNDDIVVCGSTLGAFSGYANASNASEDVVAELDSAGQKLWTTQFGTGAGDFLNGIATDSSGSSYVAGTTLGAYASFPITSGVDSGVVAKVSNTGALVWLQELQLGKYGTSVLAVAVSNGMLYVAGTTNNAGTNVSTQLLFVAELNPDTGQILWSRKYGPSDTLSSLAIDQSGDLIVSGVSSGNFPGTTMGTSTPFVVKLDGSTGNELWVQSFSSLASRGYLYVSQVALDSDGNIVLGGAISPADSIVVGYGADPSAGMWVGRLNDGDGTLLGSQEIETNGGVQITSVAVDQAGNIYTSGVTNGPLSTGSQSGGQGVFVLKFSSSLQPQWVESVDNGSIDNVAGLTNGPLIIASGADIFLGTVTQGSISSFPNPNGDVEMFLASFGS